MKTVYAVMAVLNIVAAAVSLMMYIEGGPWPSLVQGAANMALAMWCWAALVRRKEGRQ